MALDADEVVIGSNGNVYVAPVGSAGPTDPTTDLDAAFLDLGFLSEDGVTITPGLSVGDVMGWQNKYPLRRFEESRSLEVSFTMLQWNETTLPFALGGGAVATATSVHTYTPPTAGSLDERAMVIEWQDGDKLYRMHILRGMVTELGDFTLARTEASGLSVTFSVLAESGVAPFTVISDDPALAV